MLSILVPIYNCIVIKLIETLHKQLERSNIDYEIICLDDASKSHFTTQNKVVESYTNTRYIVLSQNTGRAIAKHQLCQKATYPWILFLDADVEITNPQFIQNYLSHINSNFDFIFGGFTYKTNQPDSDSVLRWKYGKSHESVPASQRNKLPYKVTIAANVLAKKESYLSLGIDTFGQNYGMDLLIGTMLKKLKKQVLHIDNPVYHIGLEQNKVYIQKKERAANSLLKQYYDGVKESSNTLLNTFIALKKFKLNFLLAGLFRFFKPKMIKNLTSSNPNIKIFQFYRISYMCWKDLNP